VETAGKASIGVVPRAGAAGRRNYARILDQNAGACKKVNAHMMRTCVDDPGGMHWAAILIIYRLCLSND
jgi:hypothetical protein